MLSSYQEAKKLDLFDHLCILWAHNSAVECHLHTVEVVGSNPAVPTISKLLHQQHLEATKQS
jgi:hypothetical protein